jgi:hypothetical protein
LHAVRQASFLPSLEDTSNTIYYYVPKWEIYLIQNYCFTRGTQSKHMEMFHLSSTYVQATTWLFKMKNCYQVVVIAVRWPHIVIHSVWWPLRLPQQETCWWHLIVHEIDKWILGATCLCHVLNVTSTVCAMYLSTKTQFFVQNTKELFLIQFARY